MHSMTDGLTHNIGSISISTLLGLTVESQSSSHKHFCIEVETMSGETRTKYDERN